MLSQKIEEICNRQVEREGYSSLLYLAMASWAETHGYPGIARWLYAQADEEKIHMLKFIAYINERGGRAVIPAFKKPPEEYESVQNLFSEVLKHEQFITGSINEIVERCLEEKDYTTHNWVQWFVTEQIEEESSVMDILDKLNLLGEKNMYMFDRDIFGMRSEAETEG
ncbi:MAG TPA: ferritin [Bacteroidetes bacterium]|nr:ferritin [Bacteroidota bacterium]